MNVVDAFWTVSTMVNYGMTSMPMEIRFETLIGGWLKPEDASGSQSRFRIWLTSPSQPALLFSGTLTDEIYQIKQQGEAFPSKLKALLAKVDRGQAQVDLIVEDSQFASFVVRYTNPTLASSASDLSWFGCRLDVASEEKVKQHLTTLVLSLRRQRDEEILLRRQLEAELAALREQSTEQEAFQTMMSHIRSDESASPAPATPQSTDKDHDQLEEVPPDVEDESADGIAEMDVEDEPVSSNAKTFVAPVKVKGITTYLICALCPDDQQTAVPDERIIVDHIARQHFDDARRTCHGCPTKTKVQDLTTHVRMHITKIYACKFCGKQTNKRNVLMTHVRTHTGEKPYTCTTCSRRFADPSTLRRHRSTHTGEMKASCPICGRIISRRDNVKAHMRNNHGIEWSALTADGDTTNAADGDVSEDSSSVKAEVQASFFS
uniref:Zinc finger protein n=1 Tax=Panagrellus redivivus TaxID=6233 RepID=A0A7E5A1J1_PANRE